MSAHSCPKTETAEAPSVLSGGLHMAAAGLAGSQVIGSPKNRALCIRANAEFENVCRCPSEDSPPRGLHGTPAPSAMDGHLWPSSLARRPAGGLPGPARSGWTTAHLSLRSSAP